VLRAFHSLPLPFDGVGGYRDGQRGLEAGVLLCAGSGVSVVPSSRPALCPPSKPAGNAALFLLPALIPRRIHALAVAGRQKRLDQDAHAEARHLQKSCREGRECGLFLYGARPSSGRTGGTPRGLDADRQPAPWPEEEGIAEVQQCPEQEDIPQNSARPTRIIRFWPNKKLIEKRPFPPPPLSAEKIKKGEELEQLLARLGLSRGISAPGLTSLFAAADDNLDRLLARLQELIREERKFMDFGILEATVRQMWWIL
jgi:hypothetical protein